VRCLFVLLAHAFEFLALFDVYACLIICIFVDVFLFHFIQNVLISFAF